MTRRKLFRYLWNFNAVAIAVASLLAIFLLLLGLYFSLEDYGRGEPGVVVTQSDGEAAPAEAFRLGSLETIRGSEAVVIPLYSEHGSGSFSSSGSRVSTRNLLFVDMTAETSFWLFPSNDTLIWHYDQLEEPERAYNEADVVAIYYRIIKDDTNGDGVLDEEDRVTIALSAPDGRSYTEVLSEADNVLGYELTSKDELLVLYQQAGSVFAAKYSLASFRLLARAELAQVNLTD
ncbi:MAG: hypothetical protein OEM59_19165 [Rhodospirillales bacterium]|nr:hypothetical protein [Rhodospirillales bacterium]